MTTLALTDDETDILQLVGPPIFLKAREHLRAGEMLSHGGDIESGPIAGRFRVGTGWTSSIARVTTGRDGGVREIEGACTCSVPAPCSHTVALVLAALGDDGRYDVAATTVPGSLVPGLRAPGLLPPGLLAPGLLSPGGLAVPASRVAPRLPAPWEKSLGRLLTPPPTPQAELLAGLAEPVPTAGVGLQFELVTPTGRGPASRFRIGLRPVVASPSGNYVRTGISWSSLSYAGSSRSRLGRPAVRLLEEILALSGGVPGPYNYQQQSAVFLEATSRRIWDLLAEAEELGIPLLQAKGSSKVELAARPVTVSVQVQRTASALVLEPQITHATGAVALAACTLIGEPAHGVAWWQDRGEPEPQLKDRRLRLAMLEGPLQPDVAQLLGGGALTIPATDEGRFLDTYYPELRRRLRVVAADDSVQLPEALPPMLTLRVAHLEGHRARLSWAWSYAVGDHVRTEPLWAGQAGFGQRTERDLAAEAEILDRVWALTPPEVAETLCEGSHLGRRLAPSRMLVGIEMIRFLTEVLPELTDDPSLDVVMDLSGELPDYREAQEPPLVTIVGSEVFGDRDWFDLAVTVSVAGEEVPFNQLFTAIAQNHEHLILPSGTYFSLDVEEFRQLATLIAESRALTDSSGNTLRLSRFQAGVWHELERIGVVSGQAALWLESVRRLTSAVDAVELPAPAGLNATLRPYQLAGFNWLAALYHYRLGGVLADDMGLGKTLQALALICHLREQPPEPGVPAGQPAAPFLVVAPTSVVFNWAAETAKFAPGLKVVAISETRARRGTELADEVKEADVVVTSYTLFRLEFADYQAMEWAGMILDEAQFVKNHQSQAYSCARKLDAPFKLAITGTPMENNLMELWSLLSITAPGLFANPTRFTEYYRTPIEKDHDVALLDQLRRRIKPLMLRRTKEQVATDLPDKQEQVIELELNPKHRKVYQTYLQRERQKVLGLLGDLQKNRFEIFRSLTLLRQASLDVGLVDEKHARIPSTKLDAMMEQVADIVSEGHRTLIFSQFTRFLDSARQRLQAAGIEYCYLDGKTRRRGDVLAEFKQGSAPVFLISLKAGGFGLNLTEADYCILLDPWWNPATEAQAVDRVHRIGQTKKVMVYRLVAKDTIEEKVMALKATKAALFNSVMDDDAFESATLSATDILGLLS